LIQYFQYLQNYLDCNLSTDRYDLPFVFTDRLQDAQTLKSCYQNFDPDVMNPDCAKICNSLGIGTISPVFEGDYDFIDQIVNFYSYLSLKARRAAKKQAEFNPIEAIQKLSQPNDEVPFIQVPNKALAREAIFPTAKIASRKLNLEKSEEPKGSLTSFWQKLAHPIKNLFGSSKEESRHHSSKRLLRNSGRTHGHDSETDKSMKKILAHDFDVISRSQKDILKRLKGNFRRSSNERILSDDGQQASALPVPIDLFRKSRLLAEQPTDRPFSLAYYEQLYDSFSFQFDQNSTEFNSRRAPPFDVGHFLIQSVFGEGVSQPKYLGNMNWEISPAILEKMTQGSTNMDESDPSLVALLFYFDSIFVANMTADASADFAISIEPESLSSDDTALKSLKPPAYDSWEMLDNDSLKKYLDRVKNDVFQALPQRAVAPVDSVFPSHISETHSRRLRQPKSVPKKQARKSWVQKHRTTRTKRHSNQKVAEARLHRQMLRSEGYGHGKKVRNHRNRQGRQLSARFLLDSVEGDLNIQPWLNV